jgi:hypothetical protein
MSCDVKVRLTSEYEEATALFSAAVTELRRKIGISTKEHYEQLSRMANDARVKSEQARLRLSSTLRSTAAKGRPLSFCVEAACVSSRPDYSRKTPQRQGASEALRRRWPMTFQSRCRYIRTEMEGRWVEAFGLDDKAINFGGMGAVPYQSGFVALLCAARSRSV